jgi:serine protease Do
MLRICLALLAICLGGNRLGHAQAPAPETPPSPSLPVPDGLALLAAIEQTTTAAIAKAERSVVAIARVRRDQVPGARVTELRIPESGGFEALPESPDFVPSQFGSGVVISEDGFIVTCAHVLDDPRHNDYYVWLDKRVYAAKVVSKAAQVYAADPFTDLAVLKIEAEGLAPIEFGTAQDLKKGQFVIALGNPYAIARDGQACASWGMIANLNRIAPVDAVENNALAAKESLHQFGTLIHTDAKLNLGTSGGALVNLRGEMVGLTTSLAAVSGYEQAAGFALAVDDMFLRVVESLKAGKLPEFGFLGIQPEDLRTIDLERGLSGAKVVNVVPGLPGDQAGLQSDDVISQVNSRPVRNRNDLFRELSQMPAGAEVSLLVERPKSSLRGADLLTLKATLSKKYVSTSRPGFALHGPQKWRGMLVEYATAVPSELTRGGTMFGRRSAPKLAILAVDPNTPAWEAGIRPGYGLLSVDGRAVDSPTAFQDAVQDRNDTLTLQIMRQNDRPENVSVASEKPDAR